MKNVLKRRVAPLIGIVAMLAVIGFMMTACGEEESTPPPSGTITIEETACGAYVGFPLLGKWSGVEVVQVLWVKDGANKNNLTAITEPGAQPQQGALDTNIEYTGQVFRPTEAGVYWAAAVNDQAARAWVAGTPFPQLTFSAKSVTVTAVPSVFPATDADAKLFLGIWEMKGADNNWEPETGAGGTYSETIVITPDSFKLDSTYSNVQGPEHVYWTITGWEKLTNLTVATAGKPSTVGGTDAGANMNITYDKGYRLNVTETSDNGYNVAYTYFHVYKLQNELSIRRTGGTGTPAFNRIYKNLENINSFADYETAGN